MVGPVLLLVGVLFYPFLSVWCRKVLQFHFGASLSICDLYFISEKCINALQGVLSTVIGLVIVVNCQGNIMDDRHWLTNAFSWFGLPYFPYDLWAVYTTHYYLNLHLLESATLKQRLKHFIRHNMLMVVHHIGLPVIFFPILQYFRANRGDYFVGVFFMTEAALPFIAIRFILLHLKLKHTRTYVFFGVLMIFMFFFTRILLFPFLYWKYSQHSGMPFPEVPFNIPIKCNLGCLAIFIIQVRIFYLMVRGAFRLFFGSRTVKTD